MELIPLPFDPPLPPPVPVAAPLSYARRLTLQRRSLLDLGVHPATGAPVIPGTSLTCGDCRHLIRRSLAGKVAYKCAVHRLGASRSAASDVRVGWPACTRWEEIQC